MMEEHHVLVDLGSIELRTLLYLSNKTYDRLNKRIEQQKRNRQRSSRATPSNVY